MSDTINDKSAEQWLEARRIIADAFTEARSGCVARKEAERFAEAVIARLANAETPIVLAYADELKDE